MASNLAWAIIPIVNENNQGYLQAVLLDSDLNIQYNTNFLEIDNTNIVNTNFVETINNYKVITDYFNNLIYVNFAGNIFTDEIFLDIYIISYQNTRHFTILVDNNIMDNYFSNANSFYSVNILSNNNCLITLITPTNIYYYIFDENLNVISGNTPYYGQTINGGPFTNIIISDDRIYIGNRIYDYNFNIINPSIVPSSIGNTTDGSYNFYIFSLDKYSFMTIIHNNASILILGDENGNIINSVFFPFIIDFGILNITSNYPTITNFANIGSSNPLTIYQVNFNESSYSVLRSFSNINNVFFYYFNNNTLYPIYNLNSTSNTISLSSIDLNTFNIINTITLSQFFTLCVNYNLLDFTMGTFNYYDENFNLINSKLIYPNYIKNSELINQIVLIPCFPNFLSNYQNYSQKNMTIVYNPLLCKMYTANELLELS